jgi:hypothetical protein
MDIEDIIPHGLNDQELQLIEKELYDFQNLIEMKIREVCVLRLLNIFKTKYLEDTLSLSIFREDEFYSIRISKLVDNKHVNLDEEDEYIVFKILELNTSTCEKIYNWSYSRLKSESYVFKNNEKGRDTLLDFFLGKDWEVWKENRIRLECHDNLINNLDNTNQDMRKKLKV